MSHHFFNTQGNFTCVAFGAMRETAGRQSGGLAQERARAIKYVHVPPSQRPLGLKI